MWDPQINTITFNFFDSICISSAHSSVGVQERPDSVIGCRGAEQSAALSDFIKLYLNIAQPTNKDIKQEEKKSGLISNTFLSNIFERRIKSEIADLA